MTFVEQPNYIGITKDLVTVYLLPTRIIIFIYPCTSNHFAPQNLTTATFYCALGCYVPLFCLGLHLLLYCVFDYKGGKHFWILFTTLRQSSSLVLSHQMFMCDLWWALTPSFCPQIQYFCTSIPLACVMCNSICNKYERYFR